MDQKNKFNISDLFFLLENNNIYFGNSRLKFFTKNSKKYSSTHEIKLLHKTKNKKIEISIIKYIQLKDKQFEGKLLIFVFYYGYNSYLKDQEFIFDYKNLSRRNVIKEFNNYICSKLIGLLMYEEKDNVI